jgi:hypothetical protein
MCGMEDDDVVLLVSVLVNVYVLGDVFPNAYRKFIGERAEAVRSYHQGSPAG